MGKRSIGIVLTALGGLAFAAALAAGLAGYPRPGWGHYKILAALAGLGAAAAGVFLLERSLQKARGAQNAGGRYFAYACFFNAALSLLPRLPFLDHISSWWRSSHTLLSSLWFQKEGIDLFHYQTPVFGPPWQVPLEFPLYQALCTVFANLTGIDLTLSARLVSLMVFYATALFLVLLCQKFLESKSLILIILTVYLWLPFNIRYSTEILPDYFSVLLAMSYLYWIHEWLAAPRSLPRFSLAAISGILGAMVKITTMPIVAIPAVLMALDGLRQWGMAPKDFLSPRTLAGMLKRHAGPLVLLAGIALLPLAAEILWVRLEDAVKQANPYTVWLTSANSSDWWYGTWSQKLSYTEWTGKFTNLRNYFLFGPVILFPVLGVACLRRLPPKSRCVFGSALAGTLLTVFIFFNLYFHEYYYIAVAAFLSILIGFGIYALYRFLLERHVWGHVFSAILFAFILLAGHEKYAFILNTVSQEVDYTDDTFIAVAAKVAEITPEDEYIILLQDDWYPEMFLFSGRKGLTIIPEVEGVFTCESVTRHPYTTVVTVNRPASTAEDLGILRCFGTVERIAPGLYKVKP
ncbi:MAG: hypothetical protein JW929_01355 [Anaerolineales bacterium]|nr:hypothetical protein [Anaerolineales bacterium]